tara:strand:- start:288 stop:590 length:303 start_codon:yes stop_codon:yes gene_type:complete
LGSLEPLLELGSEFIPASPRDQSAPLAGLKKGKAFPHNHHSLRPNYAIHALEEGVDQATLKVLLNHVSCDVTLGHVTKSHLTGHLKDAAERIADRLLSYT